MVDRLSEVWTAIQSWLGELQWGSIGEWFGGIITAVGVLIALFQIRDVKRGERARGRNEQRSNAMAVSTASKDVTVSGRTSLVGSVSNDGALPIFEVQVVVGAGAARERLGTLGPGATLPIAIDVPAVHGMSVQQLDVELRFRDAYGTVWSSERGELREVLPEASKRRRSVGGRS